MHKPIIALALLLFGTLALAAQQSEQAPILEKEFAYRDWTLKNIKGGGETNLRKFTSGKKLVLVVYWAPWCPNWRHDIEFVKELHTKYGPQGLSIIGVGEYDSLAKMENHIEHYKLPFPSVYETLTYGDRLTSVHHSQRTAAGDTRKWGTPWYIFLDPAKLEAEGDVLTKKVTLVNGELIRGEAEAYIRKALGLAAE